MTKLVSALWAKLIAISGWSYICLVNALRSDIPLMEMSPIALLSSTTTAKPATILYRSLICALDMGCGEGCYLTVIVSFIFILLRNGPEADPTEERARSRLNGWGLETGTKA